MNLRSMKRIFSEWRMASGEWPHSLCAIRYSLLAAIALVFAPVAAEALIAPRHQAAWPAPVDASAYMPACGRMAFPDGTGGPSSYFHNVTHLQCTSPQWAASNLRLLLVGFYVKGDSSANPETCVSGDPTIDFITVFIGGTAYPVTFGGSQAIKVPKCGFVLTDPLRNASGALVTLTPATSYFVRTAQSAASTSGIQPGGQGPYDTTRWSNSAVGDGTRYDTTIQTALRTSGTVPAYSQGSGIGAGPALAIATGWDGSPTYCIVGDSIGRGQADANFNGLRGITGYVQRGLDDSASSSRRAFVNLAIPGTAPDTQSSIATGQFKLRMQALRSLPNQPCTEILSEMGHNSSSIGGASLAAFQQQELGWWAFWHDLFPAATIFHTTFPPHAGQINNDKWTVAGAAGQSTDYPTSVRWQASNWFRGLCPGTSGGIACPAGPAVPAYVKTLDVTPAFQDPANPGYWAVSPYAWTVATTVSSGSSVSVAAVNGAPAPGVGDMLALEPGTSNVEYQQIASVTGAGPWTVGLMASIGKTHAAGAAVGVGYTPEGTHPTSTLEIAAAAIIEAYKNSGVLP